MSRIIGKNLPQKNYKFIFLVLFCLVTFSLQKASAQTTEFTYQGRLTDGGMSPNANYDFEFRLYDAGNNLLGTVNKPTVLVSNGLFTVTLDFGSSPNPFTTGGPRFLEIAVKAAGGASYTTLSPRQPITSAPYSIRSLEAARAVDASLLGGISAAQFVQMDGGGNVSIGGNLNVAGTLTQNIVNAQTEYQIGGQRVLRALNGNTLVGISTGSGGVENTFVGNFAGQMNTTGLANTFVGEEAGQMNTTGRQNAFFGNSTGQNNSTGNENSYFGDAAGFSGLDTVRNSFFGRQAGFNNTASGNSFFGYQAGFGNTVSSFNSFFGNETGKNNAAGSNSFFGAFSGTVNSSGSLNSFFGAFSGFSNTTGQRNSFFGMNSGRLNQSGNANSFFGYTSGSQNTTGQSNAFFGDSAGRDTTTGGFNSFFGTGAGLNNQTGQENAFFGTGAGGNNIGSRNVFLGRNAGNTNTTGNDNTTVGYNADVGSNNLTFATAVGAGTVVNTSNTVVLGRSEDTVRVPGELTIVSLPSGGTVSLCRTALTLKVANCSSSIRYKTNIKPFNDGLTMVNRLKPVTFDWKENGQADLGLVAEDVAEIETRLVIYNEQGNVEGVKYDRIGVVLLNAVKQQQGQIETQNDRIEQLEKQNREQRSLIENLRKLVCSQNSQADTCREDEK